MTDLNALHSKAETYLDNIEHIETLREGVIQDGVSADDVTSAKVLAGEDVPALECFDPFNYATSRSSVNRNLGLEALDEAVDAAKANWVKQAGNYIKYVIRYISEVAPRHDDRNFSALLMKVNDTCVNVLQLRRSLKSQYPGIHITEAEHSIHNRLMMDNKLPHTQMVMDTFTEDGYTSQYDAACRWKAQVFTTCQYYLNAVEAILSDDQEVDVQDAGLDGVKSAIEESKQLSVVIPGNGFKVDFEAYIKNVLPFASKYDDDHRPFFNSMLSTLQSFSKDVARFKDMKRKDMTTSQANAMGRAMRSMNAALYYITQLINAVVLVFNARFNQRFATLEYITATLEERVKAIVKLQPDQKGKIVKQVEPIWDSIRKTIEEINQ